MGSMPDRSYVRAPRWRQTGAGLIDAGVFAGLRWLRTATGAHAGPRS